MHNCTCTRHQVQNIRVYIDANVIEEKDRKYKIEKCFYYRCPSVALLTKKK